jgi:nuclease S1
VRDWAEQCHKAAQKTIYGRLPNAPKMPSAPVAAALPPAPPVTINGAYEHKADPLIAEQIEKAGVRLASVLNASLQ